MSKKIEIKSGEYLVVEVQDELFLYTKQLDADFACTAFSIKSRKVGIARNLDYVNLAKFFTEINPSNFTDLGLIVVNIVGGIESDDSIKSLHDLISQLEKIDNNRNIINIRSCDSCNMLHPNSLAIDCYHGGIRSIVI